MSREWPATAFAPATEAPKGFVPHAFRAAEPELVDQAALAGRMRATRAPFRASEPTSWLSRGGFVAGMGTSQTSDAKSGDMRAEPARPDPEPAPAPQIDPQSIFDAGIAEGQRQAAAAHAADAEACARLLSTAASADRFDRPALAQRLRQTVLHLVGAILGECGISPERLASRIDEAVRLLADVTEPARLSLHPDDLAMIGPKLAVNIAGIPDPAIERGGFRLETLSATIEDGPTLWLDQLGEALDRVAVPGE